MYGPQHDLNRGTSPDPYSEPNPVGSRSSRGSVIALFVIVALIGGFIMLGSLGDGATTTEPAATHPATNTEPDAATGAEPATGETGGGTATQGTQ